MHTFSVVRGEGWVRTSLGLKQTYDHDDDDDDNDNDDNNDDNEQTNKITKKYT
jgi:hypothetical protein